MEFLNNKIYDPLKFNHQHCLIVSKLNHNYSKIITIDNIFIHL